MDSIRRHALIIGNSEYKCEKEFPIIPHAVKDATKVFSTLVEADSSIFDKTTSLRRLNVTRSAFEEVLGEFFNNVMPSDMVLFYFAGHARLIGGKRLFLATTDSGTGTGLLAATAFSVDTLLPYFEEKKVNRYVVVLDCCRAGAALNTPGVRQRGIINDAEINNLSGQGKVFVAAATEYQVAHELDSLEQGLFSYYFIQGIQTGDAVSTSKQYINILEISRYVQNQLTTNYPLLGQDPVISGEDMVGELLIALNPSFNAQVEHHAEFQDFVKRSLDIDDLSDKDKLEKAQTRKLHIFLDKLNDDAENIGGELASFTKSVMEYGKTLNLDDGTTLNIFNGYLATLEFNKARTRIENLRKVNGKGKAFIFSAAYQTAAYESSELGASIFTYHFAEALNGSAASSEGVVTLQSAFEYLAKYVRGYEHFLQTPIISAQMTEDPILTSKAIRWESFPYKRKALLVGLNQYANEFSSLRYATSDVLTIGKILKDVGGFDCTILTDENAGKSTVLENINEIIQNLNQDDLFLFYFTGHGYSTDKDGYAILYDTAYEKASQALSVNEISRILNQGLAKTKIVVLDSCMTPVNPRIILEAVVDS
jgi:uncharacterized caspase-like protein